MSRKRRKSKYNFITYTLIITSLILLLSLLYVDILPYTYLTYIAITLLVIDLILIIIIKTSKKKTLGILLSLILIIITGVLSAYILKTTDLLNNLNLNYKTYNYKVVVLKNSNYNNIEDIENKNLGYYKTEGKETVKSINKLEKKVVTNNIEYNNTKELTNSLLEEKTDAILIEDSHLKILEENNNEENTTNNIKTNIDNFSDKTKVIYKFTIIVKNKKLVKDTDVTKKPFNIYISGIDTYGEISSVSRSDVNMVVTVNPKTKQILLTSIPRDYYVKLHGKTGYKDKLTHAGLYGVDTSLKTIEDLLNIEINYYIKVNFTSVIDIVESLGGVEVYSDYNFTSLDGYNYTKGYNKVNGQEALSFARERKAFNEGDRQRVKNQQALLEAMFRKCTSSAIITKYNSLLNSINKSFVSNMPTERLTALLKMQLKNKYKWTITSNSLDGKNSSNYTYSYSASKLYVMEPDTESVNKATSLINEVMQDEILESSYAEEASNVKSVTKQEQKSIPPKEESSPKEKNIKEELKVTLKDTIQMTEGEEFTYYGYQATLGEKDITKNTTYSLSINGKTYTDYKELVYYITNNLKEGEYNIVYRITYIDSSISKNQKLIIEKGNEITTNEEKEDENIEEDIQEENDIE